MFDSWGGDWGYGGMDMGLLAQRHAQGEIDGAGFEQKRRDPDAL